MKSNQHYFLHIATLFFLLTIGIALFSWIGNIYELGNVQNIISPEGVRWILRNLVDSFVRTPALGIVIMLFMGLGIAIDSGFTRALISMIVHQKTRSLKERRALTLAFATLLAYIILIISITFTPWTILRNVTGTLNHSPFTVGLSYLVSLGIGLSGTIFGFVSERFHTDKDIIRSMGTLFIRCYDYFITLFFIVQFFTSLSYTNIASWLGIDAVNLNILFQLCCYLPLAWMLFRKP